MGIQNPPNSLRNRIGTLLRDNRFAIAIEVLILVVLVLLRVQLITILFLLIGWASLWLRGSGWKLIGMDRPQNWWRTLLIGLGISVVYQLFSIGLLVPLLYQLTNTPLDLSQFDSMRGNFANLIIGLIVSWTLAGFGEEMAYRGYVLNRLADLFGKGQLGWGIGIVVSSVLFGLGHLYQGVVGVIETFVFGTVMAGLYLAGKRNLWLPIFVHGLNDTIGLILIFLGLYP